jgi:uncharacterized protein YdeI (YjbR/CyaY-like superfamily)
MTDLPIIAFGSASEWEEWLAAHGKDSQGVWLKFGKAGAPQPSVAKKDAVEIALCHGWIDGQLQRFDDHHFLTRFTPRRPRSKWSAINRETAERLIAAGRMTPAGLAEVERARGDGRWEAAYAPASRAAPPPDLIAALEASPGARQAFEALDAANRYAILYRIEEAARAETRAVRIAKFVAMLERGETLHPRRKQAKKPG